jgi:hypothetical protein
MHSLIPDRKGKRSFMKYEKNTVAACGFLWICAFVVGLSLAYGNADESVLKATPDQYDFGTIAEEQNAVVTTVIQNIGKTPVEITNVRTS